MVKDPNHDLYADVQEALFRRGHQQVTVHRVYAPGDPGAAMTSHGPATTALFVDATKRARTALIYAESFVKSGGDGGTETDWRKVVVVKEGWLSQFD
jgi:hypothetical protein